VAGDSSINYMLWGYGLTKHITNSKAFKERTVKNKPPDEKP
jgi:hypothetical protein